MAAILMALWIRPSFLSATWKLSVLCDRCERQMVTMTISTAYAASTMKPYILGFLLIRVVRPLRDIGGTAARCIATAPGEKNAGPIPSFPKRMAALPREDRLA